MLWFQLILKNTNDRILHKKFDLLCLTVGWTLLFRFISFKGHILATKLLEGDKGKSAKEYLKAMFWCLYLWKVQTSKLILLMYTWCYDGLTVYPGSFKYGNLSDSKKQIYLITKITKTFTVIMLQILMEYLQYNESCQHDWVGFVAV